MSYLFRKFTLIKSLKYPFLFGGKVYFRDNFKYFPHTKLFCSNTYLSKSNDVIKLTEREFKNFGVRNTFRVNVSKFILGVKKYKFRRRKLAKTLLFENKNKNIYLISI